MENEKIWNEVEVLSDNFEYDVTIHPNQRIFQYYSIIHGFVCTVRLNKEQYSDLLNDYNELSENMKKRFNFMPFYFIECILSYNY